MAFVNYSTREINVKIVYYGPALGGKTTNLQYVHDRVPSKSRGDLISLATEADRTLYFDNLACYQETLAPLTYEKRPLRGIQPFPGQTTGTNTGPGKLPFPTREETILPSNVERDFQVSVRQAGKNRYELRYQGRDGTVVYEYRPANGNLSELAVSLDGAAPFRPLLAGASGSGRGVAGLRRARNVRVVEAACGDGIIAPPETCDDANTDPNDGCSSACAPEPFFACNGQPSICLHDSDGDGIPDDGDQDGSGTGTPCLPGQTIGCDDNCPTAVNPGQGDANDNGVGDACEPDADADGIPTDGDGSGTYE